MLARFDYLPDAHYSLYPSERQSNTLDRFEDALKKTLEVQRKRHDTTRFVCRITPSREFPELSVIDYLMWALKRYITKEADQRYFRALEHKFAEIYDVYGNNGQGEIYNAQNPFDLSKTGNFGIK